MVKKTKEKLDFLSDIDIFLMVEKGIRGGICHVIFRYAKANDKNLYGWSMSQKLPVNDFKWVKDFLENYSDESDEGHLLEVDVQGPENLQNLHNDLSFLSQE